ncbi:CDP-alcohol phosphatidyltransferase family protein [Paludifilum halophilum]|uniref:CDP-alcohol phosphatidyltransferase family protein n=1 Tax=Paludifilum halophilum TaxID=1642702 RepID=UPI001F0AB8CA|nr:CDP-alcohol phosphatidyltransferase family protein [Paludifilum halophilum]
MQKESRYSLDEVKEKTYKKRDSWWTVILVDPLASRLVVPVANHTRVTPNQISLFAFLLGIASAIFFYRGDTLSLVTAALLYHFSFVLDCMDGKIARLKGTGSVFGMWLDYMLDRFRVVVCSVALMAGQYAATGEVIYLSFAFLIVFLDMLRYMDALQLYKLRQEMRKKIRKAKREARYHLMEVEGIEGFHEESLPPVLREKTDQEEPERQRKVDLNRGFKKRFGWYLRIRDRLEESRIRPHLFSGIEFQMFIFIIGPLAGLIKETVLFSSVLLILFEAAIIYKMWLSTEDLHRELEEIQQEDPVVAKDFVEGDRYTG